MSCNFYLLAQCTPRTLSRFIYCVVLHDVSHRLTTHRFARTDGSTSYPCDVKNNLYCGGTWKGLENKLDYIKNMGFTAVSLKPRAPLSPVLTSPDMDLTCDRTSHGRLPWLLPNRLIFNQFEVWQRGRPQISRIKSSFKGHVSDGRCRSESHGLRRMSR